MPFGRRPYAPAMAAVPPPDGPADTTTTVPATTGATTALPPPPPRAERARLTARLATHFATLRSTVHRPPAGILAAPWTTPGGYYNQLWDWDGFFIGVHLAHEGAPEHLVHLVTKCVGFSGGREGGARAEEQWLRRVGVAKDALCCLSVSAGGRQCVWPGKGASLTVSDAPVGYF